MAFRTYIAHGRDDKFAAEQIGKMLAAHGLEYFIDSEVIKVGESIIDKVHDELERCDVLAVVASPHATQSPWVWYETGRATALGKRIVPILYHVSPKDIPGFLSKFRAVKIEDLEEALATRLQNFAAEL